MKKLLFLLSLYLFSSTAHSQETGTLKNIAFLEGSGSTIAAIAELSDGAFLFTNTSDNIRINDTSYRRGSMMVRIDKFGNYVWHKTFQNAEIMESIVDTSGTMTVYGNAGRGFGFEQYQNLIGNRTSSTFFISRHDENGELIWVKFFEGSGIEIHTIKVGPKGEAYIAGSYFRSMEFDGRTYNELKVQVGNRQTGVFFMKLNERGETDWFRDDYLVKDLIVTKESELIITGDFTGIETINGTEFRGTDVLLPYVAKLNAEGGVLWVNPFITWRSTSIEGIDSNEDEILLVGKTDALRIHYQSDTLKFASRGGFFYTRIDNDGDFISGKVIDHTSGLNRLSFIKGYTLDREGNVYLASQIRNTDILIDDERIRASTNFKMLVTFSAEDSLTNQEAYVSNSSSPNDLKIYKTNDTNVWIGASFRDSISFMGANINPREEYKFSNYFIAQLAGSEKITLVNSITNSSMKDYPKEDFWVDSFEDIDRFGLRSIFPFDDMAIIGEYISHDDPRNNNGQELLIPEVDVSELVTYLGRRFTPRQPEDQPRYGMDVLGFPYSKMDYGDYAISLVRGFDPYTGTLLLWKRSNSAYKLVRIYPNFESGGLYGSPVLKEDPDGEEYVYIEAIGGDEGQYWGNRKRYLIEDDRLVLYSEEQVRGRIRFDN